MTKTRKHREKDYTHDIATLAIRTSTYGTCSRLRVGAVLHRGVHVLGWGCNHQPVNWHEARRSCDRDGHVMSRPGGGCIATVHAEMDALACAIRNSEHVYGCQLFITHMPCYYCAKLLIQLGIRKIRYIYDYESRGSYGSGKQLLLRYNVELVEWSE